MSSVPWSGVPWSGAGSMRTQTASVRDANEATSVLKKDYYAHEFHVVVKTTSKEMETAGRGQGVASWVECCLPSCHD